MDCQVLVNGRAFGRRITGVERYTREVTRRLNLPLKVKGAPQPSGVRGHLWEQVALPRQVKAGHILWSPANTGPVAVRNQVVTIHDLSAIDHPEWFEPRFAAWYAWLLPALARRVRMIVTDSAFSKQRIQAVLGVPEERLLVAGCGVDREVFRPQPEAEQQRIRRKYGLHAAYVLFIGSLEPRKNLSRLIRAWKRIEAQAAPLELVIGGERGPAFQYVALADTPTSVRLSGRIAEADLPGVISAARMLVLPSLYEGFGLPLLEAMACGTPVIASNAGALPEVASGAGLLVDPGREEEIAAAILALDENEHLRRACIRCGLERAQQFTWERTAEQVRRAIALAGRQNGCPD